MKLRHLAVVLNPILVGAGRTWKGPGRSTPRLPLPGRLTIGLVLILSAVALPVPTAQASQRTVGFDYFPDRWPVPPGTYITTEYEAEGVIFPNGVEVFHCADHAACEDAVSGANAARTGEFDEFEGRQELRAEFTSPQSRIHLSVRGDKVYDPPVALIATLRAFESGELIAEDTVEFSSSAGWQSMGMVFIEPRVTFIVLEVKHAGHPELPSRPFAIDSLSFAGAPPPEPEPDETQPTATIHAPTDGAIVGDVIRFVVEANDDRGLHLVTLTVPSPGVGFARWDLCSNESPPSAPRCPVGGQRFSTEIEFQVPEHWPAGQTGAFLAAYDTAGNRGRHDIGLTLTVPVNPFRVEVNQAVQSGAFESPPPGETTMVASNVPLIPQKDTLVRFYPLAEGRPYQEYTSDLALTVVRRDGGETRMRIEPNVVAPGEAAPEAAIPADPGTDAARARLLNGELRSDGTLATSLDFLIPGSEIPLDTMALDVRLVGVTGTTRVLFNEPVAMGLNLVMVDAPLGPAPSEAEVETAVFPYLRAALPLSSLQVLSTRTLSTTKGGICDIQGEVWAAFGGDDSPVQSFDFAGERVVRTLGLTASNGGCANYGNRADLGVTAVSGPLGDVAAHEIGHTMGLIHASTSHGETRDGKDKAERGWLYPHGTMGEQNIGAILSPPDSGDVGWTANMVDPCPGTLDQRYPECTLAPDDAARPHDFMSYGRNDGDLSPLVTRGNGWVSDITYRRIHRAIALGEDPVHRDPTSDAGDEAGAHTATADVDGRVDALLLLGEIGSDGSVRLDPVHRKLVPASMTVERAGPYSLKLMDRSGKVLASRSVAPVDAHRSSDAGFIREAIPLIPGVKRLVLERDGVVVAEVQGTRNPPEVRMLFPGDGETLAEGTMRLRWEAHDPDGDPVWSLIQYSPDGGETWQGIELVGPGEPTDLEVATDELVAGTDGLLRVTVSDGLLTDVAESVCPFSLGTDAAPAACIEVKPGNETPTVNTRADGVIPVAILTTDSLNAATIDAGSVCFGDADVPDERDCTETHGSGHLEDVDGDQDADLVLHFDTSASGIDADDTEACLTARTIDGIEIDGCDTVRAI